MHVDGLHGVHGSLRVHIIGAQKVDTHRLSQLLKVAVLTSNGAACVHQHHVLTVAHILYQFVGFLAGGLTIGHQLLNGSFLQAIELLDGIDHCRAVLLCILHLLAQSFLLLLLGLGKFLLCALIGGRGEGLDNILLLVSGYIGIHSILLGLPFLVNTAHGVLC